MLTAILCVVCFIFGALCSAALVVEAYKKDKVGTLKMDYSTGEPYLFLQLNVPMEMVLEKKEVLLDVEPRVDLTRG